MSSDAVMIYLVRHAEAGDKSAWRGVDNDRPLSAQGRREAAGLVIRLEDVRIDRVLSSPALRCAQTVRPVAARNWLPVEDCDLLDIGSDPAELANFLHSHAADFAVLCTHGEVLEQLFPMLLAEGAVVTDPLVWPKGSTWILRRSLGEPLRASCIPPLAWPVAGDRPDDDFWRPPPASVPARRPRRLRRARRPNT